MNFDEQILEACKSIAAATSALVKSATAAQRELVSQGRMSMSFNRYMPDEDGQWSQGLISAVSTHIFRYCKSVHQGIKDLIPAPYLSREIISALFFKTYTKGLANEKYHTFSFPRISAIYFKISKSLLL